MEEEKKKRKRVTKVPRSSRWAEVDLKSAPRNNSSIKHQPGFPVASSSGDAGDAIPDSLTEAHLESAWRSSMTSRGGPNLVRS